MKRHYVIVAFQLLQNIEFPQQKMRQRVENCRRFYLFEGHLSPFSFVKDAEDCAVAAFADLSEVGEAMFWIWLHNLLRTVPFFSLHGEIERLTG